MRYLYIIILLGSVLFISDSCSKKKDIIQDNSALSSTNVFVCDDNGTCSLLNTKTGALIWQCKTGKFIISSPTFSQNILYISTTEDSDYSKIIAIDYKSGLKLWEFKTEQINISSPIVVDGKLYSVSYTNGFLNNFSNLTGKLYCINAKTGNLVWETVSIKLKDSSPSYYKGSIYVLADDGLEIFDAQNGNKNKGSRILNPISNRGVNAITGYGVFHSSPALFNDICYYIFEDNFIAYNTNTKSSKSYKIENSDYNTSSPTIQDNIAYFTSQNRLIALNVNDFSEKWIFDFPENLGDIYSSPFATNDLIYIIHSSGTFAIDSKTGVEKWRINLRAKSSPNVFENIVYITAGQELKALNSANGNTIWNFKMKNDDLGYLPSPLIINEKGEAFHSSISGAKQ